MNRDFKGVWIPKEVYLDNRLNALDKIILVEIDSLDNGDAGCFASNKYLADFCQCSQTKVSTSIAKLIKFGYVEVSGFDGRTRSLKSCLTKDENLPYKNCKADSQNLQHNNIYNNKRDIRDINNNTYYNSLGSKDNNISLKTTTKDCSNLKSLEDNIYNNIKSNDELKEREKTNKREKEKIEDDITEIIEYLNLKAGKNYRTNVESNRSAIRARLNDHYTKEDCIKVIDIKVAKWKGTEYEQYLKVSTLFRPAHFDDYLNESEMLPFEEKKKNDTPEVNQEWRDMWSRA